MGRWWAGLAFAALLLAPAVAAQDEALQATAHTAVGFFDLDGNGSRQTAETVYLAQGSTVASGTVRLTAKSTGSGTHAGGTLVTGGDSDVNFPVQTFQATYAYIDSNGDGGFDTGEAAYVHVGALPGNVGVGDVRLNGADAFESVVSTDPDFGHGLAALPVVVGGESYAERDGTSGLSAGDAVFLDLDGNGLVSTVDLQLAGFGTSPRDGSQPVPNISFSRNNAARTLTVVQAEQVLWGDLSVSPTTCVPGGSAAEQVQAGDVVDCSGVTSASFVVRIDHPSTGSILYQTTFTSSSTSTNPAAANLRVLSVAPLPNSPTTQDQVSFNVAWQNNGNAASASHVVRVLLDGAILAEWDNGALPAGATQSTQTAAWTNPTAGSHTVQVVLDPYDTTPESRETDNTLSRTFTVTRPTSTSSPTPPPPPPPVPPPTSPTANPAPTSESETGTGSSFPGGLDIAVVLVEDVTVTRDGDANVITWTSDLVGRAAFQVWRSNSPYVLVATVPGTKVTDDSDEADEDSRYLVTAFTGTLPSQGFFPPGTAPDQADFPGEEVAVFPLWTVIGAVAGLLVVGGTVTYAARRRSRRAELRAATVVLDPGQAAGQDVLAVQDIRVARADKVLVDGVSFRVGAGKTTLLFGPSGSGKSLLLKSVVGLIEHSGHAMELRPGAIVPLEKRAFGYVPQEIQLYPTLSAIENILYFAGQFGIPRKEAKQLGLELLRDLGLGDRADQELQEMSGGQQRRVSVAAALIHRPRVLVMDEPSSGLDFSSRRTLWELLRRLAASRGIAVLASTHFIDEAEYASEVGIMYKGRLVAKGPVATLTQSLPGHGRCVEVAFDDLPPADQAKLHALLPQLKAAGLAATASYRLFSARYYSSSPTTTMARLPGLLRAAGLSARSSSLVDVGLDDVFTFLTGDVLPEGRA